MSKKTNSVYQFQDAQDYKLNLNELFRKNLSFEEYGIASILKNGYLHQLKAYIEQFKSITNFNIISKSLVNKNIAIPSIRDGITGEFDIYDLKITEHGKKVLSGKDNSVDEWITDWIKLWPKGIKSGGYLIRGNKRIAAGKMRMFLRDFPEFNKDIIFEATKRYLQSMAIDGFKYSKLSHYFIYKGSDSTLASECSAIVDEEENPVTTNDDVFGESEL